MLCSRRISLRPGHVFCKKVREKREKREKSPSYVQACRLFLDHGGFATKSRRGKTLSYAWSPVLPATNRTISLPTRYVLAIVPFVIRRPLSSGLGWPSLRWSGFSQVVKTTQSRGRTERTLLMR